MVLTHYEVQTRFTWGWENCWWDHETDPYAPVKSTYDTMEEARAEIRDAIKNSPRELKDRMTENDFRIVMVTTSVVVESDELQLHLG